MTKRNERTSKRIASIAGKVLALKTRDLISYGNTRCRLWVMDSNPNGPSVSWHDIRALAASALTQAPDVSIQFDGVTGKKRGINRKHKPIARRIALRNKKGGRGHSA